MRGKHYTPRPRHCPGPSHLQRKSGFEISKIAPALPKDRSLPFPSVSPFRPTIFFTPCEIANRGQLERVEEVGDTKAIDHSREDEEKKKMYRDIIRSTHTASMHQEKSFIFYKLLKIANYKCYKTLMHEKERNKILVSN